MNAFLQENERTVEWWDGKDVDSDVNIPFVFQIVTLNFSLHLMIALVFR